MKNLELIFSLLTYEGSPTNDPADAIKLHNRIQETEITATSRLQIEVADAITNQAVTLPDPNSDYLVIFVDREVSIKVNGSATAQILRPRANGKKTVVFYSRGPLTALTISNASGETANIDIFLANK